MRIVLQGVIMKRLLMTALLSAIGFCPVIAFAETTLQGLFQQEQAKLNNVSSRHLKSLLTAGQPPEKSRPVPVNFTRSWLETLPEPRGNEEWRCLAEAL